MANPSDTDPTLTTAQPPPPEPAVAAPKSIISNNNNDSGGEQPFPEEMQAELVEIKRILASVLAEIREEQLRQRLEFVPVRTSDLMRGFQAAVAKANRATEAGDIGGEDIERMAIKDLQVTLAAPIIDGGHADDPVMMLPNIKNVDADSAKVTLSFSVVSVPLKGKG